MRNKWVRRKPPEQSWTMPDYPAQFEAGDLVQVKRHGSKVFTIIREFPEVGFRGRLYEVTFSGKEFIEYEHEMTPVKK